MFQFHNGTINTLLRDIVVISLLRFNSTTVQLIHTTEVHIIYLMSFQFHNGTINTQSFDAQNFWVQMFQFHNGTINTKRATLLRASGIVFQFHNGTINTISKMENLKNETGFNSTTVQLIRIHARNKNISIYSFNSTTVQLIHSSF